MSEAKKTVWLLCWASDASPIAIYSTELNALCALEERAKKDHEEYGWDYGYCYSQFDVEAWTLDPTAEERDHDRV